MVIDRYLGIAAIIRVCVQYPYAFQRLTEGGATARAPSVPPNTPLEGVRIARKSALSVRIHFLPDHFACAVNTVLDGLHRTPEHCARRSL